MKKLCILALLSISTSSCQVTSSYPQFPVGSSASVSSHGLNLRVRNPELDNDCSATETFFLQKGGKIGLPPADGNYYGKLYYPSGNYGEGESVVEVCPGSDNNFGIPVPKGHTPDWFGQWSFSFSAVFGQGDLDGKMYSTTWLPRTDYFMYVYDENDNLIESYKMGRANVKSRYLTFPSPFQNGLSVTEGGTLNFEIVHRHKRK